MALRDGKHRRLKPNGTPEDVEYLSAGAGAQLRGEYAQRTLGQVNERPSLPLLLDDEPVTLVAPDRPGEDWDRLYRDRRWPKGWVDLLTCQTSYLVFVPAIGAVHLPDWIATQAYRGAAANFRAPRDLTAAKPPTQVVAVDWIQMLMAAHRRVTRLDPIRCTPRIGVVITAWDVVLADDPRATPLTYLKREHRLLHDFIVNVDAAATLRVFGTSLYGEDLNDPEFRQRLRTGDVPPQSLGYVVQDREGEADSQSDLALPVTWALGLD
jgi:hypothetical protein